MPELAEQASRYPREHRFHFESKPGHHLAAAVVRSRSAVAEGRVAVERELVENLSPSCDLRLLVVTVAVVNGTGERPEHTSGSAWSGHADRGRNEPVCPRPCPSPVVDSLCAPPAARGHPHACPCRSDRSRPTGGKGGRKPLARHMRVVRLGIVLRERPSAAAETGPAPW
jgi:hypothetical protein